MTDDRQNVTTLMMQVVRLYREVQNLLVAADDLMAAKSWTTVGNTCITGSNALDQPDQWLAQVVHRFYQNTAPEYSGILTYVSVLLLDSSKPDLLPESLASAGWLDYGPGGAIRGWDYWYAKFHTLMPDATADGLVRRAPAAQWPKWKLPFITVATLAVPLWDITSSNELDQRLVRPLLADIDASAR